MKSGNRFHGIHVLVFWVVGLLGWPGAVFAENCEKARRAYDSGTRLTDHRARVEAFQKAVDLCPSYAESRVNLADALEKMALSSRAFSQASLTESNKLLDRAIQQYQKAAEYRPNLFEPYLGLAEVYAVMGLYSKALDAFKKALQVNPDHALARRARAGVKAVEEALAKGESEFMTAREIIRRYKESSQRSSPERVMGFEDYTVVRDRLRFNSILFDEWSFELNRKETMAQLQEIGKALSSTDLSRCRFVVEGHTDDRGGFDRNMALSERRAHSVAEYLVEKFNIPPTHITSQGLGYSRPRFPNDTPEHMLKNRRVELLIIGQSDD